MDTLLSVSNLEVGYGGKTLLPPISFDIQRGQVTSIVGHNGSGKSTLLKTLLDLHPKVNGQIRSPHAAPKFGYVPQRETIDPIYPVQARQLVETGCYGKRGLGRRLTQEDEAQVTQAMQQTGVTKLSRRLFRTLSGGEQQRVLLARALCTTPNILVLDEPTASMDERGAAEVMALTLKMAKEHGCAILMVNHFIDLVIEISDQVVLLDRDHGNVLVGPPKEVLKNRGAPYGR